MDSLITAKLADSPYHEILPESWRYDLNQLRLFWDYGENHDGRLELELSTHEVYTTLTFTGISDLNIPCGCLLSEISIKIFNTKQYLPEMPGPIRVQGLLSFWAQEVVRIDPDWLSGSH